MKKREDMVKKVLIMLLGSGLVVGLSLPALAVSSVELHKLTASDAAAGDFFGVSVALSGATALVGAQGNDDAGSKSGAAYLFCLSPAGDLNKDCRVDLRDFAQLASFWKTTYDISDLLQMVDNWLVDCLFDPSDPACQAP